MKVTIISAALAATGLFLVSSNSLVAQAPKPESPAEQALISSINGESLYHNYCATCHGSNAKGNGPMAPVLKTPPADLTRIAVRRSGSFPEKEMANLISWEAEMASHGTREMPLWGPIFSQIAWDQDLGRVRVANLVSYLKSIQLRQELGEPRRR